MRKSNISHRYAKEKDFLVISLLLNTKTVTKTQMFENDPAYEKFTRSKQEKLNNQLFLAEFHSSTHDNAFAFQTKTHLFAPPSHQITLNSALRRAFKHFNNACSTTKGSISSDPLTTITSRSTTKVKKTKQKPI